VPEQTRRILVAALQGDAEARGALLERLRPRIVLWVGTRLSDQLKAKVEAEDVAQDILVAIHEGLGGFEGDDDRAFLSWLFRVAENRIRDLVDHFGALKRQLPAPLAFTQTSPSSHAARKELTARMRDALARLSEPHRRVIQLRRFEELEIPAVAAAMGRTESAVRTLYCRAVQALKDEMQRSGAVPA
jgi:RNA polymerase sigma-70 factor (ECF subfamily)